MVAGARIAVGLMLSMGLLVGAGASALAQESGPASLTVHQRLCGADYDGGSPFDGCHDTLVGDSYEFTLSGSVESTIATDASTGNATFENIPAGTYDLFGGIPGEFSEKEIYCTNIGTGEAIVVVAIPAGASLEITGGAEIVCDVYEHPIDLSGDDGTDDDDDTVTALPNTGVGLSSTGSESWGLLAMALTACASGLVLRRRGLLA